MPNEDINELLSLGINSINDKHIKNIYFDTDQNGLRYFFVDLTKVGVKTRVVITTIPSFKDEPTIKLSIASVTMGRVNALNLIQKRGYFSNSFINPYLKECCLPMSFDEETLSFVIKPFDWIKSFPASNISEYLFNSAKTVENAYHLNSNVFGFDLDISKLSSNREFIDVDTTDVKNIYNDVKAGCLSEYPSMNEGETKTIYSLTEETLNQHVKSSFVSEMEEEINSSLIPNNVKFDLKGTNVHLEKLDKITFTLFFSVNEYLLAVDTDLDFVSSSSISYVAYFTKQVSIPAFITTSLNNVLSNLCNTYSYFEYNASEMFLINLESLNDDPDIPLDIKYSPNSIEINHSKNIAEFKITRQ